MGLKQTPSQTIGPFFAYGLTSEQYDYQLSQIAGGDLLARAPDTAGQRIRIVGTVYDGEGVAIPDAMVEIWQADAQGRYADPAHGHGSNTGFAGFGRVGTGTDPDNRFVFDTIKPAAVSATAAPHVNVVVFARGLLAHVYTRLYFSDEAAANDQDPVLMSVPAERRETLIATRLEGEDVVTYAFDVHMQGASETVFFDV